MTRRRKVLLVFLAWTGVSILGCIRGCASAALPPEPSASELAMVRATHFRATVCVETGQFPAYSRSLVQSLRRTGLFDEVELLEDLPNASLVAHVQRPIYGTATIPVLTILSLGLVPTTVQEEWGESFTLHRNGTFEPVVAVDFSYVGPTTLGWWATVRSISPDIATVHPPETGRFSDALSVAICTNADQIEKLLVAR